MGKTRVGSKSGLKLFVAVTPGCREPTNEFLRLNRPKHPTHALQRTTEVTPLSGTPYEFTGGVWEVACCSGESEWAHDTAKTEVGRRNGTWTQLGRS